MRSDRFNSSLPANPPTTQSKLDSPSAKGGGATLSPLSQAITTPKPIATLLTQLKVGQQLSAVVTQQIASPSSLQLKIESTIFNVQTELKLPINSQLQIEVTRLGKLPEFKVISNVSENSQTVTQALKQALPKQVKLSSLLTQLQYTFSSTQSAGSLPKQIEQRIRQILSGIPPKETLMQANSLKNQVSQSGIFLEKKLLQALTAGHPTFSNQVQANKKGHLLQLLNSLKTAFKQPLSKQATSTEEISKIEGSSQSSKSYTVNQQTARQHVALAVPEKVNLKTTPTPSLPKSHALSQTPLSTQESLFSKRVSPKPDLQFLSAEQLLTKAPDQVIKTAQISQLSAELRELISKTEGVIAKIILDQLSSLPKEESIKQSWQLELPFHNGEMQTHSLKLTITQEDKYSPAENEPTWSVVLEITPPGLATIYSKIILKGSQVDSYFWSEEPSTCKLIEHNIDKLEARLTSAGLETGDIRTHQGKPAEANSQRVKNPLISERA